MNVSLLRSLVIRFALAASFFTCVATAHAQAPQDAAATDQNAQPAEAATAPAEGAATQPGAEATSEPAPPPGVNLRGKDPLEENFAAYLHFALIGQFEVADKFAQAFLQQPGVSERPLPPEVAARVLKLSENYKSSIDTLLTVISNTPIAENAKKVL